MFGQGLGHFVDELGLLKLQRRHVHADVDAFALAVPQRCLLYGFAHHPIANGDDETGFFRDGDEVCRGDRPQFGIVPADEGFGTHHIAALHVNLWLVVQTKTSQGQGLAHRMVQAQTGEALAVFTLCLVPMEAEVAATRRLGFMHGSVGMAQQLVHAGAVVGVKGNADAAGHVETQAVQGERLLHGFDGAPCSHSGTTGVSLVNQEHELVAAQAGHRVHLAQAALEALGSLGQHTVTKTVAQGFVHMVETIQVHKQERKWRAVTLGHGQGKFNPVTEHAQIGQAGERIRLRQGVDAACSLDLFCDVAEGEHPSNGPAT